MNTQMPAEMMHGAVIMHSTSMGLQSDNKALPVTHHEPVSIACDFAHVPGATDYVKTAQLVGGTDVQHPDVAAVNFAGAVGHQAGIHSELGAPLPTGIASPGRGRGGPDFS